MVTMPSKIRYLLILSLSAVTLIITNCNNNSQNDATVNKRPSNNTSIQIVTENWKPYSYTENGEVLGSSTEIVKQIFDHMHIPYSIEVHPWSRTYNTALEGKNTGIFAIVRTEQREKLFHWVAQVAPSDDCYFYKLKKRSDISVMNLEDAKALIVGANKDSDKHQFLKKMNFANIILDKGDQTLSVKQLYNQRIDLLIMHQNNWPHIVEKAGANIDDFEQVLLAYRSKPYLAFSSNTDVELVLKARIAHAQLSKSGVIDDFQP